MVRLGRDLGWKLGWVLGEGVGWTEGGRASLREPSEARRAKAS
jgi:hypothetical protein